MEERQGADLVCSDGVGCPCGCSKSYRNGTAHFACSGLATIDAMDSCGRLQLNI